MVNDLLGSNSSSVLHIGSFYNPISFHERKRLHTGVVRTTCAYCRTWKSSRSVSPVSSVHLSPKASNLVDQSLCLSLHNALIGATANKYITFLQLVPSCYKLNNTVIFIVSNVKFFRGNRAPN